MLASGGLFSGPWGPGPSKTDPGRKLLLGKGSGPLGPRIENITSSDVLGRRRRRRRRLGALCFWRPSSSQLDVVRETDLDGPWKGSRSRFQWTMVGEDRGSGFSVVVGPLSSLWRLSGGLLRPPEASWGPPETSGDLQIRASMKTIGNRAEYGHRSL